MFKQFSLFNFKKKEKTEREREKEKGTDTYPINTYKRSIRIDSSSIYPTNI